MLWKRYQKQHKKYNIERKQKGVRKLPASFCCIVGKIIKKGTVPKNEETDYEMETDGEYVTVKADVCRKIVIKYRDFKD